MSDEQSMVERGTRAIYKRRMSRPRSPEEYEDTMRDVRAVLIAMREPTEAMRKAGCESACVYEGDSYDCWQAMIDAALKP